MLIKFNSIFMMSMEYTTTYKFRIYPNKTQTKTIDDMFYLSHKLYNAMLEQRRMAYQLNKDYYKNLKVSYNTQTMGSGTVIEK